MHSICEYYKAGTILPCGSACKTPGIKTAAYSYSKHNKLRDDKDEDVWVSGANRAGKRENAREMCIRVKHCRGVLWPEPETEYNQPEGVVDYRSTGTGTCVLAGLPQACCIRS